jgi:3-hydroxyacyl-CoA dehydrogenase
MAASSAVKYALKNGVAVLHITSPPVNALGAAVRAGLVAGVEHAIGASATGLVVAGGGSTFPAGADITEFSKPHVPPSFAEVMAAFEDAPFPTAAACVEIDQCVGCTRQFFTKSFLGDDAAVLARSNAP